jgi:phosphoenolpyruvate carboxykinase (GTP)
LGFKKFAHCFKGPALAGWTVRNVGDNIAWFHVKDQKLYATNPESGFVGIAPGTNYVNAAAAMATLKKGNAIFTNVAVTPEGDVWWEGKTNQAPNGLIDWTGKPWKEGELAAHPNSRWAVPSNQCPTMDKNWNVEVPISGLIFGARRSAQLDPLIREAYNWQQGIFFGASLSTESTVTSAGPVGVLKHDPFAMGLYCGEMSALWKQWDRVGKLLDNPPKFFFANFF